MYSGIKVVKKILMIPNKSTLFFEIYLQDLILQERACRFILPLRCWFSGLYTVRDTMVLGRLHYLTNSYASMGIKHICMAVCVV